MRAESLSGVTSRKVYDGQFRPAPDEEDMLKLLEPLLRVLVQIGVTGYAEAHTGFELHQAATTASHICDAPPPLGLNFAVLNCPFLIWCANSTPLIVMAAVWNLLKPSIG